jgi:hypothetical protein
MSAPETGAEATSTRQSGWSLALWLPPVILFLYALSPGPAFKLATRFQVGVDAFAIFYGPLGFLYDHVPVVHAFYDWYLPLWGVK